MRYFLVGYSFTSKSGVIQLGNAGLTNATYPVKKELVKALEDANEGTDLIIVSICEQSKKDYETFHKNE